MSGGKGTPRGRVLMRAAGLLGALVLVAGWAAGRAWYPTHLEEVTGRADTPQRSCLYCHRRVEAPPVRTAANGSGYVSPEGVAVSADGRRLFVTAADADRLLEVDLARKQVVRAVEIPGRPHGVAVSADGRWVAVSSRDADRVSILDAATLEVRHTVASATEPLGVALSGDGSQVYVAGGASDDVLIAGVASGEVPVRLPAGNEPYAVSLSRSGRVLAVANRLAAPVPPRTIPHSELTFVDTTRRTVLAHRRLESAHMSEGVAISADASFALATILRIRNLLPLTQVDRGAVMNDAIAYVEVTPNGRTVQLPLSEVNAYFADPSGVVLTPDDRIAFVAHGGARLVTAVDVDAVRRLVAESDSDALAALADDMGASAQYVLARIPTLDNPRTMAMAPDGRRVYVAERLADSVAVIDVPELRVVDRIDLGGTRTLTAQRLGERVFHDASGTFQGQFSCRSCHPDGHSDGLIWDFEIDGVGQNLVETRSLRGIRDTAPFKWNGKNPDLATQCGPRFARVLTRSDPFTPARLGHLVAFIESLPLLPRRFPDELAEARERGRKLFFRERTNAGKPIPVAQRCQTCHRPPLLTDRLMADVGSDGSFDTPQLFELRASAPYLHDGRAVTLEEIWTVHSPNDTHGVTSDLTKVELNELVVYLRSL